MTCLLFLSCWAAAFDPARRSKAFRCCYGKSSTAPPNFVNNLRPWC